MSYKFINSNGEVIQTRTIAEFSRLTGMRYSNAKSLACGHYQTLHGWLSPKAPKARKTRFTTVLRNIRTNERAIVGKSITSFAAHHNVCMNDIWKVVNGEKLASKGWALEASVELAQ